MPFNVKDLLVVYIPVKQKPIKCLPKTVMPTNQPCGKCTRYTGLAAGPRRHKVCGVCTNFTCVVKCGACTNCTNCTNGTNCGACTKCTGCTNVTGFSPCVPVSGEADACNGTLSYDAKLKVLVLELRKSRQRRSNKRKR